MVESEPPAALGLVVTALSLIGLIVNLYIFIVVLLTKQVEGGGSGCRLLVGHLGLVGCLVSSHLLVARTLPCPLHGFLASLLHPLALWTLCGLNLDRYVAIASPLHYRSLVRPGRVAAGLVTLWLGALLLSTPPLFSLPGPFTTSHILMACLPDPQATGALWYLSLYLTISLLLPASLITLFNLKVLMIARYHRHRIARAIFEVTLSAQVTITHQKNPFVVGPARFQGRSASASVLQLVGSLLLLYGPYYGLACWEAAGRRPSPPLASLASGLLACSPSLNGLLYGVKNKLLRRTFRHYWRKKMTKSELDQEIQARTPSRRPSLTPQRALRPGRGLRHSATSTSFLQGRPRILVTRASEEGSGGLAGRAAAGSSSSVESDLTQEEERGWRWHRLSGSSASLPSSPAAGPT